MQMLLIFTSTANKKCSLSRELEEEYIFNLVVKCPIYKSRSEKQIVLRTVW